MRKLERLVELVSEADVLAYQMGLQRVSGQLAEIRESLLFRARAEDLLRQAKAAGLISQEMCVIGDAIDLGS